MKTIPLPRPPLTALLLPAAALLLSVAATASAGPFTAQADSLACKPTDDGLEDLPHGPDTVRANRKDKLVGCEVVTRR